MTFRKRIKELAQEANRPQIHRGRLAEDYDGIGQWVLVSLSQSSTSAAYKARVASGDFGTQQRFPAGTLVTVSVHRGRLEVMSLGNKSQGGGGTGSVTGIIDPITIGWDNGPAALTTGVNPVDVSVEWDGTITRWTMLGVPVSSTGSATIAIYSDTYGNFEPTGADSITGGNPPSFSSAKKGQDEVLSGWSTAVTTDNTLRFVLTSVTTLKAVSLTLAIERA